METLMVYNEDTAKVKAFDAVPLVTLFTDIHSIYNNPR